MTSVTVGSASRGSSGPSPVTSWVSCSSKASNRGAGEERLLVAEQVAEGLPQRLGVDAPGRRPPASRAVGGPVA